MAAATSGALLRIGNGYDLHRLVAGRPLILGGVTIPFERGLQGHSDADAVCHAVTDAILGAAGAGDIGRHSRTPMPRGRTPTASTCSGAPPASCATPASPSSTSTWSSSRSGRSWLPHVDEMRANLARALGCDVSQVSVKGKTNEGVDSMGAGESIAVHAVALLALTLATL